MHAAASSARRLAAPVARLPVRQGVPASASGASIARSAAGCLERTGAKRQTAASYAQPSVVRRPNQPLPLRSSPRRVGSLPLHASTACHLPLCAAALTTALRREHQMGARRRASLLLLPLLLLLQAAACVSELQDGAQPVADESGQGVAARDSVVSISVTGVEPEVRCRRQQAARQAALCCGAADKGCRCSVAGAAHGRGRPGRS